MGKGPLHVNVSLGHEYGWISGLTMAGVLSPFVIVALVGIRSLLIDLRDGPSDKPQPAPVVRPQAKPQPPPVRPEAPKEPERPIGPVPID